jgi:hypothetical protein
MGKNEQMGCQLRKRMCNMLTKQNHDPSKKDTVILNHHGTGDAPLQTNCNGPNHWPP